MSHDQGNSQTALSIQPEPRILYSRASTLGFARSACRVESLPRLSKQSGDPGNGAYEMFIPLNLWVWIIQLGHLCFLFHRGEILPPFNARVIQLGPNGYSTGARDRGS